MAFGSQAAPQIFRKDGGWPPPCSLSLVPSIGAFLVEVPRGLGFREDPT